MAGQEPIVIVGGGLAGAKAAEALRTRGYDGPLILVGEEEHRPYERPPLSKGYLNGSAERDSVFSHTAEWYDENKVELRLGRHVSSLDRGHRQLRLADGSRIGYAKVLIATGASPKHLPILGANADRVQYLRTLDDCDRLRTVLHGENGSGGAEHVVVIGGGWIGLEVAAAARTAGAQVAVVEAAELPLLGVLGREMAEHFAELHRQHGVDLRLRSSVAEIATEGGYATAVVLADGTRLSADAVVIGVGVSPNDRLAADADLAVDDGVLVDAALRTEDPDVFAVGDVARALHPRYGKHIRVEHWANALNQPDVAAAGMLGEPAQYDRLPYFFTDQYELGMEYLGYVEPGGYDRLVTRGDPAGGEFIAFWLSGGRVLAGMNVNVWDVGDQIRALIQSGREVDPGALADPGTDLAALAGEG